jgi:hypothetical protein
MIDPNYFIKFTGLSYYRRDTMAGTEEDSMSVTDTFLVRSSWARASTHLHVSLTHILVCSVHCHNSR